MQKIEPPLCISPFTRDYSIASAISKTIQAFLRGKAASLQSAPAVDIAISRLQREENKSLWHP